VVCLAWLKTKLPGLLRPENALFAAACILVLLFNLFDVGSFFFAAGICFAVVLSQVARPAGPARPLHFIAVALLAAPLLVHAAATNRQRAGDLWLSRQEPARAEVLYRSALKLEPFSYRAWLGLASIAWERGDRPQADHALQKVLKFNPGQPYANYLLSVSSWRRGARLTALAFALKATAGNQKNSEYRIWHEYVQNNLSRHAALPGN
jgi:tetratricopeptide (TPR) repeat protein